MSGEPNLPSSDGRGFLVGLQTDVGKLEMERPPRGPKRTRSPSRRLRLPDWFAALGLRPKFEGCPLLEGLHPEQDVGPFFRCERSFGREGRRGQIHPALSRNRSAGKGYARGQSHGALDAAANLSAFC